MMGVVGMMSIMMERAREVQVFAGKQLSPDAVCDYTDVEQWKLVQTYLSQVLAELEKAEGGSPEEEGELVLAILMGYCVTVRNGRNVQRALQRAERVLPHLTDAVLKCKLAVYCYLEIPDEELRKMIGCWMEELKSQGKGNEVRQLEVLMDINGD